ncbi:polysaccharide pyruvyl transferase family protein [Roseibium aggregatum]|uniref:Polysaccharide pyruvyl transferase family protein n=1 Tax=Roseibium aggregatum TaxID=187304 RepID=A0A939J530_9HYPH|nr:polysaccharide pyruvyl transferase family protein [Roseibium aggregatum]MBN9672252.1 polysaccharide pyruvyl transferase family protein [Roseibium aggregatum]
MARILVMIPSGEVYGHNNVRWYEYRNVQKFIDHYHNIGDAFVFDSSLKLLNYTKVQTLEIATFDPNELDRLREEFDYVVLRGSNYINSEMDWRQSEQVLKRLGLPVLAFGIGAQAPTDGKIELSESTRNVLRLMADSTQSIGVRGAYTAEVLHDIGIDNTRIIGCPTAFRKNDPDLKIVLPALETVKKVGITIRREVSPAYAKDIRQYLTLHRELIKSFASRFDTVLMAQGEREEKKIVLGTPEQKEEAIATLKANAWASEWYFDEQVEELYRSRLFYSDVVADYDDCVRGCDLVLGYRLHGNLMALANGVPAIYFTYDSRTREFADTFKIPSFDVFAEKVFRLGDLWDQSAFDAFNHAYAQTYAAMREFLDENNVDHVMHSPATLEQINDLKIAWR